MKTCNGSGEKYSPEQKLEYLKRYMAYWVEYRYWEKRDAVTLLECFKRYGALILTCSRPGDLVVAPFAGSGTECAMSAKEGRKFIGFDNNHKYVEMGNKRVLTHLQAPDLFRQAS